MSRLSSFPAFPGIGFDPAPGSLGAVAQLAQSMTAARRQLTEALHIITSVGHNGELRALDRAVEHTLDMHWWNGVPRNPAPLRPDQPLPPPPPETVAFPDEKGEER